MGYSRGCPVMMCGGDDGESRITSDSRFLSLPSRTRHVHLIMAVEVEYGLRRRWPR